MTFGCCYLQNLPDGTTPGAWLDRVLPRPRETFEYHLDLGYKVIASNSLDVGACLFAEDDRGPVGLVLLTGSGEHRQLALVAVRGDRRQRGLGKTLLERSIGQLRDQAIHTLTASRISSANAGAFGCWNLSTLSQSRQAAFECGDCSIRLCRTTPIPRVSIFAPFDPVKRQTGCA